jgi:hypothetical protein
MGTVKEFKVGDKVRITNPKKADGLVGEIVDINSHGLRYRVKLDTPHRGVDFMVEIYLFLEAAE